MKAIAMMSGSSSRNKAGFTLIELLVVIAILGIIAAISIPIFLGQRTKAVYSEMETNLKLMVSLAETYYADHGVYPPWPCGAAECHREYKGTHGVADNGFEDVLKTFRPGNAADLQFRYEAYSKSNGQLFNAVATGKPDTLLEGNVYALDHNNNFYLP